MGAMPGKDKKKSKNKERQEEHVPAMTIANVKEENKQIALVLEQSLQDEEKNKEQVALARIKNEEAAEENYNKRLGKQNKN